MKIYTTAPLEDPCKARTIYKELEDIGYDMQSISGGRFIFGLGTQVRPHIEKRFSSTWSKPAARMREIVQAIRVI